ncbi:MAG TPA: hypothetical protein PLB86_07305 [Dermatophilaceae bacterium]|nr:hypothetical protein [Dermatophilaceae bacterium]
MPYPPTFDRETIMPSTAFTADDRDFGARQLAKAHEIAAEPWNYGATDLEHAFITLHSSLAEHPYSLPFEASWQILDAPRREYLATFKSWVMLLGYRMTLSR